MARTRRQGQLYTQAGIDSESKTLRTGVYARLSVEDNGRDSDSMEHQICYLCQYVEGQKELSLAGIWEDNGVSGTVFTRPGWTALMEQASLGRLDCIVVKDLSRLGRDYLEVGRLLEQVFPAMGLVFLAVGDGYDSRRCSPGKGLEAAIKNLAAQQYARDCSRKICWALSVKKKTGAYLARIPPYGYQKQGSCLVPDPDSETVVSLIFACRLKGMGPTGIASMLQEKGVETPAARLVRLGYQKEAKTACTHIWRASTVQGILDNPSYCGYTVEQKYQTAYYKGKKRTSIPREQWKLLPTHQAIVSRQVFDEAAAMKGGRRFDSTKSGDVSENFR